MKAGSTDAQKIQPTFRLLSQRHHAFIRMCTALTKNVTALNYSFPTLGYSFSATWRIYVQKKSW